MFCLLIFLTHDLSLPSQLADPTEHPMGSKNSKIKPSDDVLGAKQRLRKRDGLSISDLQGHLKDTSKSGVNGKYETDVEVLPKYVKVRKVAIFVE